MSEGVGHAEGSVRVCVSVDRDLEMRGCNTRAYQVVSRNIGEAFPRSRTLHHGGLTTFSSSSCFACLQRSRLAGSVALDEDVSPREHVHALRRHDGERFGRYDYVTHSFLCGVVRCSVSLPA